jgi:hypothetical protein
VPVAVFDALTKSCSPDFGGTAELVPALSLFFFGWIFAPLVFASAAAAFAGIIFVGGPADWGSRLRPGAAASAASYPQSPANAGMLPGREAQISIPAPIALLLFTAETRRCIFLTRTAPA